MRCVVERGGAQACSCHENSGVCSYEQASACPRRVDFPPRVPPHRVDFPQTRAGSCWAFASIVAAEGAHFIYSGNKSLVSLSEEQLVSCDKADGNAGCNGGDQLPALQWLVKEGGSCTEKDYPYTSGNGATGKCKKTCTPAVTFSSATEVAAGSEAALLEAIYTTPLSLSVDASSNGWQLYSGGVYTASCKCTSVSVVRQAQ